MESAAACWVVSREDAWIGVTLRRRNSWLADRQSSLRGSLAARRPED